MRSARKDSNGGGQPAADAESTRMFREASEAATVVARQLQATAGDVARLAAGLGSAPINAVVTLARGSSDHAATYARYLIETRLGLLTSSAAPSVSSLYTSSAQFRGTVVLAISQSGKSPDLLAAARAAGKAGARVIAIVNATDSPLARLAHDVVPLVAGDEASVAATKSFIGSLAAVAHLVARWAGDRELLTGVEALPGRLEAAWSLDWAAGLAVLEGARNGFVTGRGTGLAVAQEAALKLKETCGLHAEAISSAELRHGPMAIVRGDFPVLVFSQHDETRAETRRLVVDLLAQNARVLSIGMRAPGAVHLPVVAAHAALEPVLQIQSFYRLVNALAVRRGLDPDRPFNLSKVTETL